MVRPIFIALGVGLAALIFWAFSAASFSESFGLISRDPWGLVTLADLYLSFLITSVLVYWVEPDRRIAWAVIVPLYFLGSVVTAFWLAWRAPVLLARLRAG
jgi:hypothetical protein